VYAEKGLLALKVDDPVSAIPIHLCCGAWGVIYVGIMAAPKYVVEVYSSYGAFTEGSQKWGIFYGGNAQLLLCQFIEVLVILGWVGFWMLGFFMLMSKLGLLRVSPEEELAGLDVSKHGGSAYAGAEVGGGDSMSHSKSVAEGVVRF
jgi:Amt family ammonium transporter